MKISETISRIRNLFKSVKEDAFLTDRFIYSIITKHGYRLLQREITTGGLRYSNIFTKLSCVDLQEVDKIDDSCCLGFDLVSGCRIMKSKYPLPKVVSIDFGPMIRMVTSLDYSKKYYYAHPETFNQTMTMSVNRRWNKQGYYYIDSNNYLYLFNDDNVGVIVEGLFYDYTNYVSCNNKLSCVDAQDFIAPFPDHMYAEIEGNVIKELSLLLQIPIDNSIDDNKSITR